VSGWRECKLSDVALKFAMGPFGSNIKAENFTNTGVPVIRGTNLNYYRYVDGEFVYLTEEKANQLKSSNCFPGDIVITHRGTLGQVSLIPFGKHDRYVVSQSGMKVTVNPNFLDSNFLLYFFKSNIGQNELLQHESQVGVPSISNPLTSLKSVSLNLPPIEEQKAIASVLSSLDDKIDLLHRQNKTLEALAETLFRQWFVEEAQDDWKEVQITDLFEVRDGTHDSPKQSVTGKPLITSKHILNGKLDIANAYLISEDDFSKINQRSKVDTGDILFSMIGTIGLIYFEQSLVINYAIKNIGLFKTSQNPDWSFYTYSWLKSFIGRQFIDEHKSGSTQEYVALGSMRSIVFQKPPIDILIEFNKLVPLYFTRIKFNHIQIQTLETLRDTLLPKLMSGEVRVDYP
jgi:type I restriction enzyme S subunit